MTNIPKYLVRLDRPLQLVFNGPNDYLIRRRNERNEFEDFIEFRVLDNRFPEAQTAVKIYRRLNGNDTKIDISPQLPVHCPHCKKEVTSVRGCGVGGCPLGEDQ